MKNYNKISITEDSRIELHDNLGLTGAEVSINTLPAGANVPFIHSHKNNEEIYAILDGEGLVIIDGEKITIRTGDFSSYFTFGKTTIFCRTGQRNKVYMYSGQS